MIALLMHATTASQPPHIVTERFLRQAGISKASSGTSSDDTLRYVFFGFVLPAGIWALICAFLMMINASPTKKNYMQAYHFTTNWVTAEKEICSANFFNYFCCLPLVACKVLPSLPSRFTYIIQIGVISFSLSLQCTRGMSQ